MTIYFTKQDWRAAMRSPISSERAHAICRRLLGVPACWDGRDVRYPAPYYRSTKYRKSNTLSAWFGAHYYAACAATSVRESTREALRFWRKTFAREVSSGEGGPKAEKLQGVWRSLWRLAVRRVWAVRDEALKLDTSLRW